MKKRIFLIVFGIFILFFFGKSPFSMGAFDSFKAKREDMVRTQIESRGVRDPRILKVMRSVPRHLFVPVAFQGLAYADRPLSIGHKQTISQPYIVAYMTEVLELTEEDRVLEIGTGSGYQAAVLGEIVKEIYTIELVKPLAEIAKERLEKLGYDNITVKHGDGYLGWPEFAPFDAIIVTAAPPSIPPKLVEQLAEGGRMVVPVGEFYQELVLIRKQEGEVKTESLIPVRFVPMIKG